MNEVYKLAVASDSSDENNLFIRMTKFELTYYRLMDSVKRKADGIPNLRQTPVEQLEDASLFDDGFRQRYTSLAPKFERLCGTYLKEIPGEMDMDQLSKSLTFLVEVASLFNVIYWPNIDYSNLTGYRSLAHDALQPDYELAKVIKELKRVKSRTNSKADNLKKVSLGFINEIHGQRQKKDSVSFINEGEVLAFWGLLGMGIDKQEKLLIKKYGDRYLENLKESMGVKGIERISKRLCAHIFVDIMRPLFAHNYPKGGVNQMCLAGAKYLDMCGFGFHGHKKEGIQLCPMDDFADGDLIAHFKKTSEMYKV